MIAPPAISRQVPDSALPPAAAPARCRPRDQQVLGFGGCPDQLFEPFLLATSVGDRAGAGARRRRGDSGQGRPGWRGSRRRGLPRPTPRRWAAQNTQGRAERARFGACRNGVRRSSRGNHSATVAKAATRPMRAKTAICFSRETARSPRRIADQGGDEPQRDGGQDIGQPLFSGCRRAAERGGAVCRP